MKAMRTMSKINMVVSKIDVVGIQHSPAPWKVVTGYAMPYGDNWKIEAADGAEIAQDVPWDVDTETNMANARVMALAPEMLAILKEILKGKDLRLDGVNGVAIRTGKKRIRDIIKRAEGETT